MPASALQKVMLLGAPISAIVPEIIYLVAFGTVFLILAFFTFQEGYEQVNLFFFYPFFLLARFTNKCK